jgi:hypothetical protein
LQVLLLAMTASVVCSAAVFIVLRCCRVQWVLVSRYVLFMTTAKFTSYCSRLCMLVMPLLLYLLLLLLLALVLVLLAEVVTVLVAIVPLHSAAAAAVKVAECKQQRVSTAETCID